MKKESIQEDNILEIKIPDNATYIISQAIGFLRLFLPVTLAKRLVAITLLACVSRSGKLSPLQACVKKVCGH